MRTKNTCDRVSVRLCLGVGVNVSVCVSVVWPRERAKTNCQSQGSNVELFFLRAESKWQFIKSFEVSKISNCSQSAN